MARKTVQKIRSQKHHTPKAQPAVGGSKPRLDDEVKFDSMIQEFIQTVHQIRDCYDFEEAESYRFNEFHTFDRTVVQKILSKEFGDHKGLVRAEVDLIGSEHSWFLERMTLFVLMASQRLRVSRYAILDSVRQNIEANY